ncbi:MAG: carboxypeptidase regulatory-like domain-containing protein, partial [Verrucomicrobia bacterium]|nr:carboxypeptidase regulatory-like domain-containing protein [Verrucomicrobiota bacterium]
MRNPNRWVGLSLVFTLAAGLVWWTWQDRLSAEGGAKPVADSGEVGGGRDLVSAVNSGNPSAEVSVSPPKSRDAVSEFRIWERSFRAADEQQRIALIPRGMELAQKRARELSKLADKSPAQLMARTLPLDLIHTLPPEIAQFVERPINGMARVKGSWTVSGARAELSKGIEMLIDGEVFEAEVLGGGKRFRSGSLVPVNGLALGRRLFLAQNPVRRLSSAEVALRRASGELPAQPRDADQQDSWVEVGGEFKPVTSPQQLATLMAAHDLAHATMSLPQQSAVQPGETNLPPASLAPQGKGVLRILVARFRFPDDPTVPAEEDDIVQFANRAASIIKEWSFGQVEVIPTFTPLITLRQARQYYVERERLFFGFGDFTNFLSTQQLLLQDARRVAFFQGYDPDSYDHFHGIIPPLEDSSTEGLTIQFAPPGYVQRFDGSNTALVFPTNLALGGFSQQGFNLNVAAMITALGFAFGTAEANGSDTRSPWRFPGGPPDATPFDFNQDDPIYVTTEDWHGFEGYNRNGLYAESPEPEELFGGFFGGFFRGGFLGSANLSFDFDRLDPFDILGDAPVSRVQTAHFNVLNKILTGWLPTNYTLAVSGSSTTRLHAFDSPTLSAGNVYAISIQKDVLRTNWLEYRAAEPGNPYLAGGVTVHWGPWEGTFGGSQLIDSTPGSPLQMEDAPILLGRTFSDSVNGIHITPIARGVDAAGPYMDVVVNKGWFTGNTAPSFELIPSAIEGSAGQVLSFTASNMFDQDGDRLAVHWQFGDGTFGDNAPSVQQAFGPGQWVVRCEVSDMKGGVQIQQVMITIDGVQTARISGRILDQDRQPLPNVRVALIGNATGQAGFTDSEGRYLITGVLPDTLTNVAHLHGYRVFPLGFENPAPLQGGLLAELNFQALKDPTISVVASGDITADNGGRATFRFTREQPDARQPLVAFYRVDGSAVAGVDYNGLVSPLDPFSRSNFVVFGPGELSREISIQSSLPPNRGGDRSVVVSVLLDPLTRIPGTNGGPFAIEDTNTFTQLIDSP